MRRFTPYELNQLLKFGFDPDKVATECDADIPIEYITGKVEFFGNVFEVTRDTLIPRPETEELIKLALSALDNSPVTFADIGTGSGAIGLTFAKELEKRNINFKGYLSDISDKALEVAERNLNILHSIFNIQFIKSNLLTYYPTNLQINIIFANLPYIPSLRINQLDNSVKNFEPLTALDGGEDGFKYIRELLKQAPNYLEKNGIILLEVDDTHTDSSEFNGVYNIEIKNDENGKNRFWICQLK